MLTQMRKGEVPMASRAVTPDLLLKMHEHNTKPKNWKIREFSPSVPQPGHIWGSGRARRMLQAAYVLSFLCLLLSNELLKIQVHGIKIVNMDCFILTLPFRKTDQYRDEVRHIVRLF